MAYDFRNLVFEGGGAKGIAYAGALDVLEEKGILQGVQRIAGTSAGAINAIFPGLGFTRDERKKIFWSFDFTKILDDSWGYIRDIERVIEKYGWFKGDYLRQVVGGFIKEKTGSSESTFRDIETMRGERGFKSLYMVGTNLSTGLPKIYSHEHTPDECVAEAVRISASIPLVFAAVRDKVGDVLVDGGLLGKYPVKLFDREKYLPPGTDLPLTDYPGAEYYEKINSELREMAEPPSRYVYNKQTLGFRLKSVEEPPPFPDYEEPSHEKIDSLFEFTKALIRAVIESMESYHLHKDDWERTIFIDTPGVGGSDFDLDDKMKKALIKSGADWTNKFLNKL